ncbi:MAG: phosphate ABC transporter, permease protein PstA, partial [Cyanobacteria bacterium J06573_11]
MKTDVSSRVVDNNPKPSNFTADLGSRYTLDRIFKYAAWGATGISVVILAWLLVTIVVDGIGTLNWEFITNFPSRRAERAGIIAALTGTVWVMGLVAL